ncbi:PilN domain-containing protein [Intestinirhabdus alba]|jgi:pilus assembly protein HofN|uniref:DNA utilization protein HofN n=1 Tax=Intestinirhabdus alba TaxID=2899544 RepID=A0A6L6IP49_9ENTR|nr:PilN domain-containing protein [Intestinirhabdus alba]MTH47724.1 DNA utilization protein HofN [Intestinirhabdus alba]
MNGPVNLLPWREARRTACLRRWSVRFVGALLAVFGISSCYYLKAETARRIGDAQYVAETRCTAALQAARLRLQARRLLWLEAERRARLRDETRRWQPALQGLAALLPERAWLTQIAFQQGALSLTGLALNLAALAELEQSLDRQSAFLLSRTGAVQQDAQGRWQFFYQLTRADDDAQAD